MDQSAMSGTIKLSAIERLRDADPSYSKNLSLAELKTLREELMNVEANALEVEARIRQSAGAKEWTKNQRADWDVALKQADEASVLRKNVEDVIFDKNNPVDVSKLLNTGFVQGGLLAGDARAAAIGSPYAYRDGAPLDRTQTFTGYVRSQGHVRHGEDDLSFGKYVRGIVTGDWQQADAERRAMSEGVLSGGGYAVPTILSAQVIDLARNKSRVIEAGAQLFPMASNVVDLARWESDPVPAWRAENAAIAATDGVLGRVRLTAKSLAGYTVLSRELLEDASNISTLLTATFADQFALTIDKMALYGDGTSNQPTGIKSTSGVSNLTIPASGVIEDYNWIIDSVGDLRDTNEEPTAAIMAPRTERKLGQLQDTTGQPMLIPPYLNGLPMLSTNQVPVNLGVGTDKSDLFVGDFSQVLIGVRTQLQITLLTERWADFGQVGVLAWWRGDIALARPNAFNVTVGIL